MNEPTPDTDLSGTIGRLIVERQRNGYLVTVWPMHRRAEITRKGGMAEFTSGEEYVAAGRDELADLVKRLMAEPPEGKAP